LIGFLKVSLIYAIILGIIQGLTEFFPISSSAHLKLAKHFFGLENQDLYFDLVCHLGTLFALLIFIRSEIRKTFLDRHKIIMIFVATLPLIPAYVLLKPLIKYVSTTELLGAFLIITSIILFLASSSRDKPISSKWKIKDMIFIGFMQTLALFPGISRCGFTISAACFRGWEIQEAIKFSFLLAIPTILGGTLIESWKVIAFKETTSSLSISSYVAGFLASLLTGFIAVRIIFRIIDKKKLPTFAWYCLILGAVSLIYLNFFENSL